jgi:hypothetical protein
MEEPYQVFTVGDKVLKIYQDDNAESPREWDNVTKMVCFHKRYRLGDKHEYKEADFNSWDEVEAQLKKDNDIAVIKVLRLYSHSGITISISEGYPYNDRWDAGIVGFVFVTKDTIKNELGVSRVTKKGLEWANRLLEGEVATYDQFLRGDVYGYRLVKKVHCDACNNDEEEDLDSCWGFYGDNWKENGILDNLDEADRKAIEKQLN